MVDVGGYQHELRRFVAPEVLFGCEARHLAGRYCRSMGARCVLVVTDAGIERAGWVGDLLRSLEQASLSYSLFDAVSPNPRAEEVMAGAEQYRTSACNAIVAIGGGSPIDCAKGIGVVTSNKQHILELTGADRVPIPMPPLLCLPTTSGSSADLSQFAIISDRVRRLKLAIVSKAVVPDISIIDPVMFTTMDRLLTASTGVDALVHGIEAFVSNASSPMTDVHALEAVRLVSAHLRRSVEVCDDLDARYQMGLASVEAGLAFSNASLGAVHATAHSLGGYYDLPHGECNALMMRHVMAFNFSESSERFLRLGQAMGLELSGMTTAKAQRAILSHVDELRAAVGLTATLSQRGVQRSDVPELAQHAAEDVCLVTNPRRANRRDLEVVYEEAL